MLYLAPNVFIAPVRDKLVILDLTHDKYLALSGTMSRALLALIDPASKSEDVEDDEEGALVSARQALLDRGILASEAPAGATLHSRGAQPPVTARWPSNGWERKDLKTPEPSEFIAVMKALTEVAFALKVLPFHKLIAQIAKEPVRGTDRAAKSEQDALDGYHAARPWFPIKPICRLDAPALCLHLRRNGHPADLIFGVTLESFAAHCWVQCGDRVMKEPSETVASYSPIMVV